MERADLELDRWIYLDPGRMRISKRFARACRSGTRSIESILAVRKRRTTSHASRTESAAREDARRRYEKVAMEAAGRWFAADASHRLEALSS